MSASSENFNLPFEPHPASIQARFESFHRANPAVLDAIVEIAREAKRRGYKTWGIKGVFEVLRWSKRYAPLRAQLRLGDGEGFQINNIFSSRYARLVEEAAPDLQGFFHKRKLLSE